MKKSIYQECIEKGIETDHHESDLYIPAILETREIIKGYEHRAIVKIFRSQIDNKLWYDVPFAYDPFWKSKRK